MQFQKLTISLTLATLAMSAQPHATAVDLASAPHASTRYDAILQQLGLKTTQPQRNQPQTTQSQATQSQAMQTKLQKSISTNQAGQTFFGHPPTLTRAASSQLGVSIPSTYEFTLTVPQAAGQPLKAVTITQAKNAETIKFDVGNSKAHIGRRLTASSEIRLANVGGNQPANPGEATIVFDQPVLPGSTVTISLAAQKNPTSSGIYLFGVTAYPEGENGLGQFLGYGRISFYGNSN
jgi:hypothetical protein